MRKVQYLTTRLVDAADEQNVGFLPWLVLGSSLIVYRKQLTHLELVIFEYKSQK